MELKAGQHVTVILYHGPSEVEADALYHHLKNAYDSHKPIPLNGSSFDILVEGAKKETCNDSPDPPWLSPWNEHIVYRVILKGELCDAKPTLKS